MIYFWIIFIIIVSVFFLSILRKSREFGFFIVLWEFGSWKTQNTTWYLKYVSKRKQINITNYYTWYSDFQLSSHDDIINILDDIYQYHDCFQLLEDVDTLYTHKKEHLELYLNSVRDFANVYVWKRFWDIFTEFINLHIKDWIFLYKICFKNLPLLIKKLKKEKYFEQFSQNMKFNIVLDEWSIYFNPRNFAVNFSWKNERLLEFIYQPRKLNILMFVVVQSPMELDVKFRRLAQYYRKYYTWLGFYRWYRDFYFLNPEEMDLEKAQQVWGGMIMGANFNFYSKKLPYYLRYPNYKYNTKELIRVSTNIYQKWSIFTYLKNLQWKSKSSIL